MEPVQLANPENAFEGGVLDKKWMFNVVGHLNLWHAGEVKLPSTEWGSGKILVSNTGWVVDLTRLKVPASSQVQAQREFQIVAFGANTVKIYNGTLFGELPHDFEVNNSPMFTLTVANNDKIYAAITWDRRVLANGDIVSTITSRTIEAAATVPANNTLTATRHYQLASVTLGAGNIPVIAQSRWGPIDDLPGTASNPYLLPPSPADQTTAQTDYYDLTVTGKGKDTDDADLAPTYDSVTLNKTGFVRFVNDDGNSKAFVRPAIINSIGQVTYTGPEELALEHVQIDVLVGLRLYGGELQGQYKKVWVIDDEASSPEWVDLITTTASVTDTCP
jgi:hypothetical protein